MEDIYIHHHLGLGDHICMNGLVRQYTKKYNVYLFCKSNFFECISFMYRDTNIKLIPITQDGEWRISEEISFANEVAGDKLLRIGFDKVMSIKKNNPNMSCDEWFYTQVGIDYGERWRNFYIERDLAEEERVYAKLNPKNEPYIFVHDDPKRSDKENPGGFIINVDTELPVIRNDMTENIFFMGLILERAEELHLMESSLKCYLEHLNPSGCLFFHDIRKYDFPTLTDRTTRHKWKIISHKSS